MKRNLILAAAGIALFTSACGSNEAPLYSVNTREMSAIVESEGLLRQTGEYEIEIPGRPAHRLDVEILQTVVKGEEDVTLNVTDLDAGVRTAYTLSDENASVSIDVGAGKVDIVVNPDETVSVDGTLFATTEEAGDAVASSAKLSENTPESLAAADDQLSLMEEVDDGTSKGKKTVKKVLKKVITYVAKRAICYYSDGTVCIP